MQLNMLRGTVNKFQTVCIFALAMCLCCFGKAGAQTAWFIDGYHGGVYGGYPEFYTRFLVDMLNKNPDWKINLEIEPETWDKVERTDSAAFAQFKALAADQSAGGRIEFINPDYAQSYLYNISGESIIRQFSYGMKKIRTHFPNAVFSSYSSEEPCFTSALPEILTSIGIKYVSLKNPNTCFGGYAAAHGGELVTWIGPDGTGITTAPRYAIEKLSDKSTWQTIGYQNSPEYVNAAYAAGIAHPIAMTIQDAGWKGGPFMGNGLRYGIKTIYTTWRNYFENVAGADSKPAWTPTQEDILVNLVWGSQVTQKIAQEVRAAENKMIMAEKLASLAKIYGGQTYPGLALDSAWRTLLLSQHHDCWIVPYNGKPGLTWADKVLTWTNYSGEKADSVINISLGKQSAVAGGLGWVAKVYNSMSVNRDELVQVAVPDQLKGKQLAVVDGVGHPVLYQRVNKAGSGAGSILFKAAAPSMGYSSYYLQAGKELPATGAAIRKLADGRYRLETDLYVVIINPKKGGVIESLVAKKLDDKQFVDKTNVRGFNELRGNFYKDGGFKSSEDTAASVEILENGPLRIKVAIKGTIDHYPFTQFLSLVQGQQRIDVKLNIDWKDNPGIGEATVPGTYKWQNPKKAFYDDRYKLLALFPLNLAGQVVYKNAPFDVTKSRLENTFYGTWDSIKNNVILNWVDVTDSQGKYGMALFTDHTTSYAHGTDFPLGLDIQYSGMGLWGKDYKINGPTSISYSILPHEGKWDQSRIWSAGTAWSEPLTAFVSPSVEKMKNRSLLTIDKPGYEITAMTYDGDDLLVRVFNAEGDAEPRVITFNGQIKSAELVELNGALRNQLPLDIGHAGSTNIKLAMPQFGIRTLKIEGLKASAY
jgi:alpha-mannosidase